MDTRARRVRRDRRLRNPQQLDGNFVVSTVPLPILAGLLRPEPPPDVLESVNRLDYRALIMLEIDEHGLDEMDKRILEAIVLKFSGGPVGVNSLAVAVGEEPDTIEEVYEPYLIMEGYLNRTAQGRVATELAYKRFGLPKSGQQPALF